MKSSFWHLKNCVSGRSERNDSKQNQNRIDNNGSALLTVIIVITFITILATTLLYMTSMNYQMKQADYQNKQSFYKCETMLDDLKGRLTRDVSMAFQESYKAVMTQYMTLDATARQEEFQKAYMEALKDMWTSNKDWESTAPHRWDGSSWHHDHSSAPRVVAGGSETEYTAGLKAFMEFDTSVTAYNGDVSGTSDIKWVGDGSGVFITQIDNSVTSVEGGVVTTVNEKLFVLKGIRTSFVTDAGYSAYILTDLGIKIPKFDFTEISSETDVSKIEPVRMSDCIIYMNWKRF